MKCGNTFLLHDEHNPSGMLHLHIVITDPDEASLVVLVSVTTERGRSDTMTRLSVGDHPFIKSPSVITYAYSRLRSCAYIEELVRSASAVIKEDASGSLVQRAQAGMRETDRAPREVKDFFVNWWERHPE